MTDHVDRLQPDSNQQSRQEPSEGPQQALCPGCHQLRPCDTTHCPHCGLRLAGELAAHLRHIDDELHGLAAAMAYPSASAQAYFGATPTQLTERYRNLLAERGSVLQSLYDDGAHVPATELQQTTAAALQTAASYAGAPGWTGYTEPAARPETSPKVVQNTLLALGGLLLGAAAITFTVLAWGQLGIAGRSIVLGAATSILLVAPVTLMRRELRATAETVVVLGLLLLALDGYAAWRAVFSSQAQTHFSGAVNGFIYSAAVAAVVGAAGLCYRAVARLGLPPLVKRPLAAPPLVAAIAAHAIGLLTALGISPTALSFAAACLAITTTDVVLLTDAGERLGFPLRLVCFTGAVCAGILGIVTALAELSVDASTTRSVAGAGLVLGFAVVIVMSGWSSERAQTWSGVSAALGLLLIGWDAALLVQRLSSEPSLVVTISSALGLCCAVITVLLPQHQRTGAAIGTVTILILTAIPVAVWTLLAAWGPIGRTDAPWRDISDIGIRMLCAVVLICVAWALLQWRARPDHAIPDPASPNHASPNHDAGERARQDETGVVRPLARAYWRSLPEAAIGPALLVTAIFTTTIGPLSNAPLPLLVALPLCGALMITSTGLLTPVSLARERLPQACCFPLTRWSGV